MGMLFYNSLILVLIARHYASDPTRLRLLLLCVTGLLWLVVTPAFVVRMITGMNLWQVVADWAGK